jgi:hypothetical protein
MGQGALPILNIFRSVEGKADTRKMLEDKCALLLCPNPIRCQAELVWKANGSEIINDLMQQAPMHDRLAASVQCDGHMRLTGGSRVIAAGIDYFSRDIET